MRQKVNSLTVRELHTIFGMSLNQMAESVGIAVSTIATWYIDERYYVEYLVELCNLFRLPLNSLLIPHDQNSYLDSHIKEKVMDVSKFRKVSYVRSRINLFVKEQKKRGIYIDEIAKRAGIARTTLFSLKREAEKGKSKVISWTDFNYLSRLSDSLEVSISDFFDGSFSANASDSFSLKTRKSKETSDWKSVMERRMAGLEEELACSRALMRQMQETMHRLIDAVEAGRIQLNEGPSSYMPAGTVSKEPDTATSAVKSM